MRRVALVRREAGVLVRSPGMWLTLAIFAAVHVLGALLPALAFPDPDPRLGAAFLLGPATDILLPAIAIVFGHGAIAARRESGEAVQLLGLPYRRDELCLAVSIGRIATVTGLAVVGSLPALLAVVFVYGDVRLVRLLGFVAATGLAGASYTAIVVAISAVVATRLRALGVALGGFVVAYAIWGPVLEALRLTTIGRGRTGLFDGLEGLSPLGAYGTIADAVLPAAPRVQLAFGDGGLAAEQGAVVGGTDPTAAGLVGPIVVLVAWACLSTMVAVVRFRRVDLA